MRRGNLHVSSPDECGPQAQIDEHGDGRGRPERQVDGLVVGVATGPAILITRVKVAVECDDVRLKTGQVPGRNPNEYKRRA
jgi:hypothetical protein